MIQDLLIRPTEGCDAIQCLLSETADQGNPIPPHVQEHLESCAECAHFARLWVEHAGEQIAALERPAGEETVPELRRRILGQVAGVPAANAVSGIPVHGRRAAWTGLLSKVAAGIALASFALWLLKPAIVKHPEQAAGGGDSPALIRTVAAVERPMKRERRALGHAVGEGGERLRDTVQWSLAMFQE